MRRVLLAVLVVAGAMLLGTAPADAGGPTSVLLTNPDQGRATAIYYSDPRYAELDEMLHGAGTVGGESPDPTYQGDVTYLNVTWLVHDVMVWRTDTLVLDQAGRAWVSTHDDPMSDSSTTVRLDDGERVRDLVRSLGLIGAGDAPVDTGGQAAVTAPDVVQEEASVAPAPTVREETRWFSLAGWRWAVPGLLLGLLAAVATRRRRTDAPRQELIDGRPERVTSPG
jgi:hypothetical protein